MNNYKRLFVAHTFHMEGPLHPKKRGYERLLAITVHFDLKEILETGSEGAGGSVIK